MKKITLLLFLMANFSLHAELVDKTSEVDVVKSRQQFNRVTRTINVPVTITNTSDSVLVGEQRLAILNASIPLSSFDGTDDDGIPFLNTPSSSLAPGESISIAVSFQLQRSRLTFDTLFFVDVEEQIPTEPLIEDLVFADGVLTQCVEAAANLNNMTLVSELTSLDCSIPELSSLSGIQQLINLAELNISQTNVADLSPLFELESLVSVNVDSLVLDEAQQIEQLKERGVNIIGDIRVLLSSLSFPDPSLNSCVQNTILLLDAQFVSDIRRLICDERELFSLQGLEQLSALNLISLTSDRIEDHSPISELTQLSTLVIRNVLLDDGDLAAIIQAPSLVDLRLDSTSITDLSLLSGTNIRNLFLSNTLLDISPLAELPSLRSLSFSGQIASNFDDLAELTQLTSFSNFGTLLTEREIEVVYTLKGLQSVIAQGPVFLDNEGLQKRINALPNLVSVRILNTRVTNLDPLTQLSNLQEITLGNSPLEDLSALFINGDISQGPIASLRTVNISNLSATRGGRVEAQIEALRLSPQVEVNGELQFLVLIEDLVTTIADQSLRDCIIENTQGLTFASEVLGLFCSDTGIQDLQGIQGLTSLLSISLFETNVEDFSPVSEIATLRRILIDGQGFDDTDLESLASISSIFSLILSNVSVQDFSVIASFNGLGIFSIDNSSFDNNDLEIISSSLSIREFQLGPNTQVDSLSSLSQLATLRELNIFGNQAIDISTVIELERLTSFGINIFAISDFEQIGQLTQIQSLSIFGDDDALLTQEQIDIVYQLTGLRELSIGRQDGLNNEGLAELVEALPNLVTIDISGRNITDISPVASLRDIQRINLFNSAVTDISALFTDGDLSQGPLASLRTLNIGFISTTSGSLLAAQVQALRESEQVEVIGELTFEVFIDDLLLTIEDEGFRNCIINSRERFDGETNLTFVSDINGISCSGENVRSIEGIDGLTSLTQLTLTNTRIDDYSPISQVDSLQHILINDEENFGNEELQVLSRLPHLFAVTLRFSSVTDVSALSSVELLRELNVLSFAPIDISSIATLSGLQDLTLARDSVGDFEQIAALTQIRSLTITGGDFAEELNNEQVQSIYQLANLEELDIVRENRLDNEGLVELVNALPNLTTLSLGSETDVTDLSPLAELNNIQRVTLFGSSIITDISGLFVDGDISQGPLPTLRTFGVTSLVVFDDSLLAQQIDVLIDNPQVFVFGDTIQGLPLDDALESILDPELVACIADNTRFISTIEQVTFLNCQGFALTDLTGLEAFTNLENLTLSGTQVTDLTPILELSGLRFLDIEGLILDDEGQLDVLRERGIDVQGNAGVLLSSLTFADPALEACVQEEVSFNGQRLVSELTFLSCSDAALVDLTGLEQLTALTLFESNFNRVTDFSAIAQLPNLQQLNVGGSRFNDEALADVIAAPLLSSLSLSSVSVTDLSILLSSSRLSFLSLNFFSVDIAPLAELESLRSLSLFGDAQPNFSEIGNLFQLTSLDIFNIVLSQEQVDVVYQLSNLRRLNVSRPEPLDNFGLIELVEALPNLEELDLSNSEVTNLDVVSALVNLRDVQLRNTPIEDISGLFVDGEITNGALPNLSFLGIDNVPVLPDADNNLVDQVEALRLSPQVFVAGELAFGELLSDFVASLADEALRNCILDNANGLIVTGQIEFLSCSLRDISDLSGLEQLTNLQSVFINSTNVRDLTPILELPNLDNVDINNLLLDDPSQLDILRDRGVNVFGELASGELLSGFLDNIPDAELRACIANSTNGLRTIEQVTFLNCQGFAVTDLTGLEAFTNLENLTLSDTQVTDLTPILELSGLRFLDIGGLILDDESQLDVLRERGIDVQGNAGVLISSLTFADPALETCVQNEVSFNGQRLVSELTFLICFDGALVDLSGIEQLTSLVFLELGFTSVTDFSPMTQLPNLAQFNVLGSTFTDESLSQIITVPTLRTLSLDSTSVTDLGLLLSSVSLNNLFLNFTDIDISPLVELLSLRNLALNDSFPTNFSDLGSLTQLTNLSVFNGALSAEQIDIIYQLNNLRRLDIQRASPLNDDTLLELVEALPNLESLNLADSQVTTLDAALGLANLTEVTLVRTPIEDISGLFIDADIQNGPLPSLSFVDITSVPVLLGTDSNLVGQVEALRSNPQVFVVGELVFGESINEFITSLNDEALVNCIVNNANGLIITGQIRFLACGFTPVSDLSGVDRLSNLESVFIGNTNVTDLTPLLELPNLRDVGIENLTLDDPEQVDLLRNRGVNVFESQGGIPVD